MFSIILLHMKYVWIFAAVVILVRIDLVMKFFDKQATNFQNNSTEVSGGDLAPPSDLVSVDNDLALKTSPRKTFMSILNDFQVVPDENFRIKGIEILRANPTMFTDKIDREFESVIYRWRDLLIQRNKEAQIFLIEMMKSMKGENLEMLKRVLSFAIDAEMTEFLTLYAKSTDSNCMIMGYLGDPLPEEEKFNELSERLTVLETLLTSDKLAPEVKVYAQRCQIVLKLQVDKLKTAVVPYEDPASAQPAPEAAPSEPPPTDPQSTTPTTPGTTP